MNYSNVEWTKVDEINVANRNHNCGFVRDEYGNLKDSVVMYTGSNNSLKYEHTGDVRTFLPSYRIYEYQFIDCNIQLTNIIKNYLHIFY